jgi:peptidyl-prolyl cis-trans isomerase C
MRRRHISGRALALWALAAGTALAADTAPLRVGALSLSASELAARLGAASPDELRALSREPREARLKYVDQVLAPELLFRAEAERLGVAKSAAHRAREADVLYRALVAAERAAQPPPSDADLAAYYQAHERDFSRPRRLRLWRILVGSEDDAKKLIAEAQGAGGPERWRAAARDKSLDTATRERGGDLGFVHPDGFTDVPELRVDKALFEAAERVADGALVPEPVREGNHFAVVWRRGSLTETRISLDDARPTILRLLLEERTATRIDRLVTELGAQHVSAKNPTPVERIEVPAFPAKPQSPTK